MSVESKIQDAAANTHQTSSPAATVDVCGLTCGGLEPLLATHLRALAPGDVLEVQSDRGEAYDGILAWLWLTGHTLLRVETDSSSRRVRYFVRKNAKTQG